MRYLLFLLAALALVLLYFTLYSDRFENWSIGIYRGESLFGLSGDGSDPVLTAADVTDVKADFVADPFMVKENGAWYMFFEVYNDETQQGDIGYAESADGLEWKYRRKVLDEPFHLSYPYVFYFDGKYYMIPESHDNKSVRLYRADNFPENWTYVSDLLKGGYFDSSVIRYNGTWWMFTTDKNDMLYLFYAERLEGPWLAHPKNPIVSHDSRIARPGGRIIAHNGSLIRFAQDDFPYYGNKVSAFRIFALSRTDYEEEPMGKVLEAGSGWNDKGMHNIDPHETEDGWIAAVDGHHWSFFFN